MLSLSKHIFCNIWFLHIAVLRQAQDDIRQAQDDIRQAQDDMSFDDDIVFDIVMLSLSKHFICSIWFLHALRQAQDALRQAQDDIRQAQDDIIIDDIALPYINP